MKIKLICTTQVGRDREIARGETEVQGDRETERQRELKI